MLGYRRVLIYLSNHKATKKLKPLQFVLLFIAFNLILALAPGVAQLYYPEKEILLPAFWKLFALFSLLTFLICITAFWRMSVSNKASGQAILGTVTIKLLFCMVLAFIYLSNYDVDPTKFLLNFFYLYFFHTVFAIYCLLRNLRNQNLK